MPDYKSIISRSIKVVKRRKWLIVYGLVLAVFGTGSGGSSSNISSNNIQEVRQFWEKTPEDSSEKVSQVLGSATNAVIDWFTAIPPLTWVALILIALLLIILAFVVGLIVISWAKGALIYGVEKSLREEEVDLSNTSSSGISSLKNLIILALIATGLGILIFFVVPLLGVAIYYILKFIPPLHTIWLIFAIIFGVFFIIFAYLIFAMIGVYAERLIVLQNLKPWEAWKKGLSLSKDNFFPTLVMGIINKVLSSIAGCISFTILAAVLAPPAYILIKPLIDQRRIPTLIEGLIILLLLVIFTAFSRLISGVLIVFKYANWNQFYSSVLERTVNGK